MARSKKHKDVDFMVYWPKESKRVGLGPSAVYLKNADEAAGVAVARSMSTGEPVFIDVLVGSAAGARWYGGDDAVEQYEFDPDTSVFERFVVRAESKGRIP